ncbi:MAG: Rpn family recombination-promoting nuclease/putative transposase [Clostridium sp.]|uniref:Rpn family recombination-promoting nuclease/putative transposase n=1 Tax=Clostridium sp. TaxID=1506 RepID=UPI003EE6039C
MGALGPSCLEVCKKEFTKDLKVEDLTLVNKSFIASDYEETESDIVYKAKIGDIEAIFYILLEFQSRVDYRMPLRLLFYVVEILREFSKNENHKKTDKNIKIPAVVTIVLYNGNQVWDVPTEFRRMFYNEEKFHSGILNFAYDIFDVNNGFTKEELLEHKNVTSAIFLLDQKITAMEFMNRIKDIALFFDGLSEEELKAIKHWIKNTTEERLANNAFMLKELKDEGKKEKQIEIAKNLLDVLEDEIIAKKTGLNIEEVIKLRKEYLKR